MTQKRIPIQNERPDATRRDLMRAALATQLWSGSFGASAAWAVAAVRGPGGYGKDPALEQGAAPWPRQLDSAERALLGSIADRIIPQDDKGPGALAIGIVDFLDEWLSAPYADQQIDLQLVRPALRALTAQAAVPVDAFMLLLGQGGTESHPARRIRTLVIIGWGTTPQAAPQLGFVGNEPRASFDGPPLQVFRTLNQLAERR